MRTFKMLLVLFVIAGLFIGCGTTRTTSTPSTPSTPATTAAPSPTATTGGGGDKASVEAYVKEFTPIQEQVMVIEKEWDGIATGADKMKKEELSAKIDEHLKKHAELKDKVTALKADNDDTKAHQGAVIEIIDIQVTAHNALKDKYTKDGLKDEDKSKLDEAIKKGEEDVKTKMEDLKTKFDAMLTKYEIKKDEGTSKTDAGTATPGATDTATPTSSPTTN
jgi:hypothetical protein